MAEKLYRRLPGTGYRRIVPAWAMVPLFFVMGIFVLLLRGNRIQLWQGKEHLLLVEWSGSKEKYKRFDYRDIQAFVIQKTSGALVMNIILTLPVVLFLALSLSSVPTAARIVLLSIAAFFGLILLINAIQGASCKCFLRTAVQIEEVPSLNRIPNTRKVIGRLRPLIAAAQGGELPAGAVAEPAPGSAPPIVGQQAAAAGQAGPDVPPIIQP